ncbi:MAG: Stp1/IreP family PP2C-type Ser/Thr phosphatase, partial [Eubacteriales bacterium]
VSRTHIGNVRETNEDFVMVRCETKPNYMLVADGMGGAAAGEIASKIAAFSVQQYIEILKSEKLSPADLIGAVSYANNQIVNETRYNERLKGMGTTMTLAAIEANHIIVAQVGDSCAYLYTHKQLHKVTKDHTYVQSLIDNGLLEKSQVEDNPFKNIITRCVGMNDLEVDTYEITWNKNDILLLCTDGLTVHAGEQDLCTIISSQTTITQKADDLLDYALSRGGRDNVSIIIAQNTPEGTV